MSSLGKSHSRLATNVIVDVANVGGLIDIVYIFFLIFVTILGKPFRNLSLAISFSKLSQRVND